MEKQLQGLWIARAGIGKKNEKKIRKIPIEKIHSIRYGAIKKLIRTDADTLTSHIKGRRWSFWGPH